MKKVVSLLLSLALVLNCFAAGPNELKTTNYIKFNSKNPNANKGYLLV